MRAGDLSMGYIVLIALCVFVVVSVILVGVVFFVYLRSKRNSKVDQLTVAVGANGAVNQPQRFAMPRINRTDTRI